MECRIADAAHAAEDIIEGHILNRIVFGSRMSSHDLEMSCIQFYQNLERVIEEMDLINKEVMQIKETKGIRDRLLLTPSVSGCNAAMIGVDEMLIKLMDMLTNGTPDRLTISITGMGGIGKTTLARNIYENEVVERHFDILAWVTISQEYTGKKYSYNLLFV